MNEKIMEIPDSTLEQKQPETLLYLEGGLNKWHDLVRNRKWELETRPEQEVVWKKTQQSIIAELVCESQNMGIHQIFHYWPTELATTYSHYFLPKIEEINKFCKQNNIPFSFSDEYTEKIISLHDKLIVETDKIRGGKSEEPPPKDTSIYDTDPIVIPFLPFIKQIEKELEDYPELKIKSRNDIKIQESIYPDIIKKILRLLNDAIKSGSSYIIGDEAKEAIDIYLEDIRQKKELYKLLKERGIKIPSILIQLNTKAILKCIIFEWEYNNREFELFSSIPKEQILEYLESIHSHSQNSDKRIDFKNALDQLILGQDFIDLQEQVTQTSN